MLNECRRASPPLASNPSTGISGQTKMSATGQPSTNMCSPTGVDIREDELQLASEDRREADGRGGVLPEVSGQLAEEDALTPDASLVFSCSSVLSCSPESDHDLLAGPFVTSGLAKDKSSKGEDKWLVKPDNAWIVEGMPGAQEPVVRMPFSAFGVFDGHGGRQVATFASNQLLGHVLDALDTAACDQVARLLKKKEHGEEVQDDDVDNSLGRLVSGNGNTSTSDINTQSVASAQDLFARSLPTALEQGFARCNSEACHQFRAGGGTTATLVFVAGWHLVVANVGDSLAVLDTGLEICTISGNHRLDDNAEERRRVMSVGSEVEQATVNNVPVGPLRVWPGGLAMSRTLGDAASGEAVCAIPAIRRCVISREGARLIVASDGLWDALPPKAAVQCVRTCASALEAAQKLLAAAVKKDHLRDDVTVVVADFAPCQGAKCGGPHLVERASAAPRKRDKITIWNLPDPALARDEDPSSSQEEESISQEAEAAVTTTRRELVVERQLEEEVAQVRLARLRTVESAKVGPEGEDNAPPPPRHPSPDCSGVATPTLHEELLTLRLSPEALREAREMPGDDQESGGNGEWEIVSHRRPSKSNGASEKRGKVSQNRSNRQESTRSEGRRPRSRQMDPEQDQKRKASQEKLMRSRKPSTTRAEGDKPEAAPGSMPARPRVNVTGGGPPRRESANRRGPQPSKDKEGSAGQQLRSDEKASQPGNSQRKRGKPRRDGTIHHDIGSQTVNSQRSGTNAPDFRSRRPPPAGPEGVSRKPQQRPKQDQNGVQRNKSALPRRGPRVERPLVGRDTPREKQHQLQDVPPIIERNPPALLASA